MGWCREFFTSVKTLDKPPERGTSRPAAVRKQHGIGDFRNAPSRSDVLRAGTSRAPGICYAETTPQRRDGTQRRTPEEWPVYSKTRPLNVFSSLSAIVRRRLDMNPDLTQTPREELESKLTAMLVGELSAEEAFELGRTLQQDLELAKLYERLKQTT